MPRIDFSEPVKKRLAQRAGYRCSFPGCQARTAGPSDESSDAVSNSGTACHIIAASDGPGARRKVPGTPAEKIGSINNGVWMCATHGEIVDNDEVVYSIDMLRTWRALAEYRAGYEHKYGRTLDFDTQPPAGIPLAGESIELRADQGVNQVIGEALIHCCVPQIWGSGPAHAIRDFLVEMALNALTHGGASVVALSIEPDRIVMRHAGSSFDPLTLVAAQSGGGGRDAATALHEQYGNALVITFRRCNDENELIIALPRNPMDVVRATQCAVEFKQTVTTGEATANLARTAGCSVIYVVLPRFFGHSDRRRMTEILDGQVPSGRRLVFVAQDLSDPVAAAIRRDITDSQVIQVNTF